MTKLDGDARGGAALSVKAVTGKPILFASTGEKLDQFERFHPDRMAQRILGMGDVMTLIEKAEATYDEEQAAELERKLRKQEFGLDDFLDQMRQVRRLGPLQSLLGMIPGMGKELRGVKVDEREFDRIQAIILSMTPQERRHPELIKGSRRLRIARGLGHQRAGGQAADQAVRADAQGHAPGLAGPDARPRGADAPGTLDTRQRPGAHSTGQTPLPHATLVTAMSVRLRLTRIGGRKNPIWRVVVADQRTSATVA